jgi:ParB-like chromosome segregation protein Spo0J
LDALWLDQQPREIVPEDVLQQLIASGRGQPAALLAELKRVGAADPYYAEILDKLEGLARSIGAEGVLQPIQIVRRREQLVVRDGHRRCLASVLAGLETVPAVEIEEPTELEAVARALIVNVQREDLTAIEKGAALLRLALLVARRLGTDANGESTEALTLEALLGDVSSADEDAPREAIDPVVSTTVTGRSRALAASVRDRVCAMVGLQPRAYYRLLALNRLSADARIVARGLTENQLRPIVTLPAADQAEILEFARRRGLSSKEITTLAQVARAGDRDAVRRVMARLSREDVGRSRTAVSWDALLHAVPKDVWRRCQALRAELEALTPEQRRTRLDTIWEQDHLLQALRDEFAGIFAAHGYRGPGSAIAED